MVAHTILLEISCRGSYGVQMTGKVKDHSIGQGQTYLKSVCINVTEASNHFRLRVVIFGKLIANGTQMTDNEVFKSLI